MRFSEFFDAIRINKSDGKPFTFSVFKEFLKIFMIGSSRFKSKNNRDILTDNSGKGKSILSEPFEPGRKIKISMNRDNFSSFLVNKTDIKLRRRNINTNKKRVLVFIRPPPF